MLIGNRLVFGIESYIMQAYTHLSSRALGFFVIHINGICYGVRENDATMLGCSFDEVKRRIADRGKHIATFAESDAGEIAAAFRSALYADVQEERYFGMSLDEFCRHFDRDADDLMWAPDGDEAFDDGSYILQFDVKDRVRLIAFKSDQGYSYDRSTLADLWLPSDSFYFILQEWCNTFEAELEGRQIGQ